MTDIEQRLERLEAENRELRRLWIENEGDIISLRAVMHRYLAFNWYKRLTIKWGNWHLHTDVKPANTKNKYDMDGQR